jgi:hypothetical protein
LHGGGQKLAFGFPEILGHKAETKSGLVWAAIVAGTAPQNRILQLALTWLQCDECKVTWQEKIFPETKCVSASVAKCHGGIYLRESVNQRG